MISKSLKFVFIHITKTAGSSITYYLQEFADDEIHINTDKDHHLYGDLHVKSKYLTEIGKCATGFEHLPYNNAKHLSLQEYRNFYGKELIDSYFKFTVVRNPYHRFISGYYFWFPQPTENQLIEENIDITIRRLVPQTKLIDSTVHVVKYENLIEDLNSINFFTDKGIFFDNLPVINENKIAYNPSKILNPLLRNKIYTIYKNDFETFGYNK